MPTAKQLQQRLRQHGQRLTKQRQAILAVLSHTPQSVTEIRQQLTQQGQQLDKSTVYRNLNALLATGLVLATKFQGDSVFYELAAKHHHHHVRCEDCGQIEDIELDEASLLQAASAHSSFQIKKHNLEFFGLCPKCK